ncbi:MAG: NTP transferase domain-containing protein [Candidatus Bathyarchaeia archaeon]|nr:NTP transferase domain-containing protein [Candidatus Bathyarchaeota archaeon]
MGEGERLSVSALVLAAGEGSRLRDCAESKPLLQVAGVPLIGRVLRGLKEAGVQKVWIAIGYKGDLVRQKIGDNYAGLEIYYIVVENWKKGNLYSLLAAEEVFKHNFLLCMSDHVFDPEIPKKLVRSKIDSAVVLAVEKVPEDHTKVLEKDGLIFDIGKKFNQSNVAIDTGLFLCSPKIFEYARQAASKGMSELSDCIRIAAQNGDAQVVDVTGHWWVDVDTKDDFHRAKRLIVENSQKRRGASDFVAHYFNRPIENAILYYVSEWGFITPNRLTILTNILAWFVTYLFLSGHLGLGSLLTFVVGIIDGLDGKLARIRGCSTKLGLMEHPFDMLYEFSWLIALALFLSQSEGLLPLIYASISIMFIAFYRFCYDQFSRATGISLDVYGKFERAFRRIAGRRNIYNIYILLGVLLGVPLHSLLAIMVHSALTAVVYAYRASVHLHALDKRTTL